MITIPHNLQTNRPQRIQRSRSVQLLAVLIAVALGLLDLTLIALPASAAAATPTFQQVRAKEITTGKVNSLAFNSANTAGNLIVVYLVWSNRAIVTVSDSSGNSYANATARTTWATTGVHRCSTPETSPPARTPFKRTLRLPSHPGQTCTSTSTPASTKPTRWM
jgi:hypothetical protein